MKFVVLKIAQKFPRILGLLLCEMCYQEDEKIAQSGHTGTRHCFYLLNYFCFSTTD